MLLEIGQEIYKAQQRIIDHRAFLNSEIDTFLENFELKRKDGEILSLFHITETVGALKTESCGRCARLAETNLNPLAQEVLKVSTSLNDFLAKAAVERPLSEQRTKSRQAREKRRAAYLENLQHDYTQLDSYFQSKEEETVEFYADVERKLRL